MYEGAGQFIGTQKPDANVSSAELVGGDSTFFVSKITSAVSDSIKNFAQWLVPEEENKVPAQTVSAADISILKREPAPKADDLGEYANTQTIIPALENLAQTVGTANKGVGSGRFDIKFNEENLTVAFAYNGETTTYPLDKLFPAINSQQLPSDMSFITSAARDVADNIENPIKLIRGDGQTHLFMNLHETNPQKLFVQDKPTKQDTDRSVETEIGILGIKAQLLAAGVDKAVETNTVEAQVKNTVAPVSTDHVRGLS